MSKVDKKKINIRVMHVLPNLEVGGVQKVVLDLIDSIPDVETSVAAVRAGGEYQPEFERRCATTVLADEKDDRFRSYLWFKPGPILRLARKMRQFKPDIVQTHTYPAAIVGRSAAILVGVPVIIETLHNTYTWKQPKDLRIDAFLARWTDRIVCVSKAVKNYAIEQNPRILPHKFDLIYNGVDINRYHPRSNRAKVRRRLGIAPDDLVVGAVGRLVPQKRVIDLIEAAPEVVRRFPKVKFLIAGTGPLAEQLADEANRRGLQEVFIFAGMVSDMENVYPIFDVFAQLAEREGFNLTIMEAMASRIPVIAANAAPIREIVRHGHNGLTFEVGSTDALAEGLCSLLGDAKKREKFATEAERDVRRKFTLATTAQNWRSLYGSLLEKRRRR